MLSVAVPLCNEHTSTIRSVSNILSLAPRGQFTLKLWPSGDFSIGRRSVPTTDKGAHPLAGITKDAFGVSFTNRPAEPAGSLEDQVKVLMKLIDLADARGDSQERDRLASKLEVLLSQLGLSVPSNSHKIPKRRGGKGITPYGKRMVRSGAALLARSFQGRLAFATLTLPALSPSQTQRVCQSWGELMRQFFQELGRELERKGLPTTYLYVSEIQEKRYQRWGVVAPHVHFLFVGRVAAKNAPWKLDKTWFARTWGRLLSNLLGQELPMAAATRVEAPRGDVRRELGKYLSKGGSVLREIREKGQAELLPSAYWGMAKSLRSEVKKAVQTSSSQIVGTLIDSLKEFEKLGYLRYREIVVQQSDEKTGDKREIIVGFCGYFRDEKTANIINMAVEKWRFKSKNSANLALV